MRQDRHNPKWIRLAVRAMPENRKDQHASDPQPGWNRQDDMNETEQRIKISGACGWQRVQVIGYPSHPKEWDSIDQLPDYLNDLNAMHEAEESLNPSDKVRFYWMLAEVVNPMQLADKITFPLIHAKAEQRAEAFLRTKGLWKS